MAELPTGIVTFLFTDVEGSTRLWEDQPDVMRSALARHDEILRDAVASHGGQVVKSTGDGMLSVFASVHEALGACLDGQRVLMGEVWSGSIGPLRVRMGLHAGEAELRDGDYYGSAVNRAARLTAVGHGGQVLVSESVEALIRGRIPSDAALVDLGVHRLRDLAEGLRVFQLSHPDLLGEYPPLRSLDVVPGNLPRQVSSFVGRERELAELGELVRRRPLVTLTGVGGVGKTRLALQVAAEVAPDFPDGAWCCELASVGDADALWDVLASTLRLPLARGRPVEVSVLEYLASKRLLVVLDNCEHLLESVAGVVDALLQRCSGVVVLATSREGLALPGERLIAVPALGLPATDIDGDELARADAVRLFVERAQDTKRDFVLSERNALAVAQLCRRLDGIPLAIELAAARVRVLAPQDLVERLDQRFRVLTRGSRVGLARHQTLRSTIDWSYELLSGSERAALNRLSVFAGGCDLAAAEAVLPGGELEVDEVLEALGQLVDKSLVVVDPDERIGTRYSQLETIRQYAQEHLEADGEASRLRARHAEHFIRVAEDAGPRLRSREQLVVSAAMAREVDNFRAVLDWALETESADDALRLVAPFTLGGMAIGDAAVPWADAARAIPGAADHELFPMVVAWSAWGKVIHGDYEQAQELAAAAAAAQARLGTHHPRVDMACAVVAFFRGDSDRAYDHAEEWVRRARASGDPYELSSALITFAVPVRRSDPDAALVIAQEGVKVARDAGIYSVLSIGLSQLASYLSTEHPEEASAILDEVSQVALLIGDRLVASQVPLLRCWFALQRRDWDAALRFALDAADQKLDLGDLALLPTTFGAASTALAHLRAFEASAVLYGTKDNAPFITDEYLEVFTRTEAILRDALGNNTMTTLRARGASMPASEAVAYLRAETERVSNQ